MNSRMLGDSGSYPGNAPDAYMAKLNQLVMYVTNGEPVNTMFLYWTTSVNFLFNGKPSSQKLIY